MGLESAARKILLEQASRAGLLKPQVEVQVLHASYLELACRQPLVEALDTRYPARMRFAASCPGSVGSRQEVTLRAEISAEVLVATTSLSSGHTLVAEDLASERRDVSNSPDAVSDLSIAVGQALKRSLRPGQVLQRQMLAVPLLVRRGDTVRIVARSGPVEVSNAGEALENGHADDVIRVRNPSTGRVIRVRVIDRGSVEPVDLPAMPISQSPE